MRRCALLLMLGAALVSGQQHIRRGGMDMEAEVGAGGVENERLLAENRKGSKYYQRKKHGPAKKPPAKKPPAKKPPAKKPPAKKPSAKKPPAKKPPVKKPPVEKPPVYDCPLSCESFDCAPFPYLENPGECEYEKCTVDECCYVTKPSSCDAFYCYPYGQLYETVPCGEEGDPCSIEDCCDIPLCVTYTDTLDFYEPFNTAPAGSCYTDPTKTPRSGHAFFMTSPLDYPSIGHTDQFHYIVEGHPQNELRIDVTGGKSIIKYVVGLDEAKPEPCFLVSIEASGLHDFEKGSGSTSLDGKIPDPDNEPNTCWDEWIVESWSYFDSWQGSISGLPGTKCEAYKPTWFEQYGPNMQIGDKASILGDGSKLGMSGWCWFPEEQPDHPGLGPYVANPGSQCDVNIDLEALCLFL